MGNEEGACRLPRSVGSYTSNWIPTLGSPSWLDVVAVGGLATWESESSISAGTMASWSLPNFSGIMNRWSLRFQGSLTLWPFRFPSGIMISWSPPDWCCPLIPARRQVSGGIGRSVPCCYLDGGKVNTWGRFRSVCITTPHYELL